MNAPVFGTAEHKKQEIDALGRLSRLWHCSVTLEGDQFSLVDGRLYVGDDLVSVIEYKHRSIMPGAHDTYILDARKWNDGKFLAALEGCHCGILLEFADGSLWWADVTDRELDIVHDSGRTNQTRFEGDIKDVVFMPREWFKPVKPDGHD